MMSCGAGAPRTGIVILSNVLIGIIGVILFIGLALAGALFLGPRFQESTNNSKASASVQAVSQVVSAISLYQTQEGTTYTVDGPLLATDDLLTKGYLKSIYKDSGGGTPFMASTYDSVSMGGRYVILGGLSNEVCKAIQRQVNKTETIPTNPAGAAAGCAVMNSNHFVFSRI